MGKKWRSTITNNGKKHTVSHGDSNYRISPGTKRGESYCARWYGIRKKYGKTPRNEASRKKWQKWHCKGKKSVSK